VTAVVDIVAARPDAEGPSLDDVLLRVAGHGLAAEPDGLPSPPGGWGPALERIAIEGLSGLLLDAVEHGRVDLTAAERVDLVRRHEAVLVRALRHEAELVRLADVLDAAGAVVLKGPGLAHGVYDRPEHRPFTDLDVLVEPVRMRTTVAALERFGYVRPWPDPTPRYLELVAKAVALTHPAGLSVDLHRTLVPGPLAERIDTTAIVARRTTVRAGRIVVPVPAWEDHLLECALHGAVGHAFRRPLALRDVAQVLAAAPLDADQVIATAQDWGTDWLLALTLERTAAAFGVVGPAMLDAWRRSVQPSDADRALAAACLDAEHRSARLRLAELREGSWRRRAELARSLAVPRLDFLRHTYGPGSPARLYATRWRELAGRRPPRSGAPS
jgi:hypothetical protein